MTFDYDTLVQYAMNNQFLVGGIGTVVAGAVMYALKSIPLKIYTWVYRFMTIEINLNNQFPMYEEILRIISGHRLPFISRLYAIDSGSKIISGFGRNYAFYNGRLMIFTRSKDENKTYFVENTVITILSRNKNIFHNLIDEASTERTNDTIRVHLLSGGRGWGSSIERSKRSMGSVFMAQSIKDEVRSRIDWFLANRDWYIKRGINYKLVFMLHGIPGSGKTSFLRALASEYNYRLGVVTSLLDFDENIRWAPEKSFIVVEDIDALGNLNRDKEAPTGDHDEYDSKFRGYDEDGYEIFDYSRSKATPKIAPPKSEHADIVQQAIQGMDNKLVHDLLNSLDGLNTRDGSIIFMTTNHLERLDAALVRPGRLDCCIEIGALAYEDMARMYESFYDTAEGLTGPKGYEPIVGAKLQEIFMRKTKEEAVKVLYGNVSESVVT